jgi:hypothetical protein
MLQIEPVAHSLVEIVYIMYSQHIGIGYNIMSQNVSNVDKRA